MLALPSWPVETVVGYTYITAVHWGALVVVKASAVMAEIVNLRTARKRAKRQLDAEHATQARVSHGMSKAARALARLEQSKVRRELDEHRIETGESDEVAGR